MKFKSTWIVAGIFLVLAAYLVLVDTPRHEAEKAEEEQQGLLFPDFDPEQVNAVHLTNPHGEATVTKQGEGVWQILQPWQDRANEGRVRSLLSDLEDLRSERQVADPDADLEPFGLDEPEVTVRTDGPAQLFLAVGGENPSGDVRYVRSGEGAVLVVQNSAVSGFLLQLEDLRSPDVVGAFPWDDLTALEMEGGAGDPIRLQREEGLWRLLTPLDAPADPDAVQPIVDKLRWAKVNSFLSGEEDRAEEELAGGTRVTLRAGEDHTVTVRLAEVEDRVWAHRSGRDAYFTVPGDVLEALAVSPRDLQRRRPVLVKAWQVNRLELQRGAEARLYRKVDGTWLRDGEDLSKAEADALQKVLDALENTRAETVIATPEDPESYGLEAPALSVSTTSDDDAEHSLVLGSVDGTVYARGNDSGPVYRMPREYLQTAESLFKLPAPTPEDQPEE